MALSQIVGAAATWWTANRSSQKPGGTLYNALVTDLAVGDFLVGPRCTIATIAASTGTPATRTATVTRLGFTWTMVLTSADTLTILR
jgi:hypothetical protein